MLSSPFRNALRRSVSTGLNAPRASLWTRAARTPRRYERTWMPAAAGALTLSVGLMVGGVVRLDSADSVKPKPKAKSKQAAQAEVETKPSEFLQSKEDEAKAESSDAPEGEASGEDADADASSGASAGTGGAFNPETGEINWDCPCLGGMAHGPCGPEFREAFSCFVYSEDEPKGINCVEKFKGMQDCFRRHPEVYGEEIMAEDDDDAGPSGTDSPGLEGELPPVEPISDPSPGATVTPSSQT